MSVRLMDATACTMSAAGPLGGLGLSTIKGIGASNVYTFELPEPGEWVLNASCGGRSVILRPQVVSVPAGRRDGPLIVDVQVGR
jgi:hypothetical protein